VLNGFRGFAGKMNSLATRTKRLDHRGHRGTQRNTEEELTPGLTFAVSFVFSELKAFQGYPA
jgi:hypothetical protein